MKEVKFTVEHYKDNLNKYKTTLEGFVLAEFSFDPFEEFPNISTANEVIKYAVCAYNSVYLDESLENYINSDFFIAALGETKDEFANTLLNYLTDEYTSIVNQYEEETKHILTSSVATEAEIYTANLLKRDQQALAIFIQKLHNEWQKREYGSGGVMKLICNPDKLDSFITKNKAIIEVITETVLEHAEYKCSQGEELQNGNS